MGSLPYIDLRGHTYVDVDLAYGTRRFGDVHGR